GQSGPSHADRARAAAGAQSGDLRRSELASLKLDSLALPERRGGSASHRGPTRVVARPPGRTEHRPGSRIDRCARHFGRTSGADARRTRQLSACETRTPAGNFPAMSPTRFPLLPVSLLALVLGACGGGGGGGDPGPAGPTESTFSRIQSQVLDKSCTSSSCHTSIARA